MEGGNDQGVGAGRRPRHDVPPLSRAARRGRGAGQSQEKGAAQVGQPAGNARSHLQ